MTSLVQRVNIWNVSERKLHISNLVFRVMGFRVIRNVYNFFPKIICSLLI
jgi:hypothetical protein